MALPKAKDLLPAWVKALESGEYSQTRDSLQDNSGFCCLGVLCDVASKQFGYGQWDRDKNGIIGFKTPRTGTVYSNLPNPFNKVVRSELEGELIWLNDDEGLDFEGIAQVIRYKHPNVFSNL
jgi:hypothetical protein